MSCRDAIAQLWAYIDGELGDEHEQQVHDHLAACGSCQTPYDYQKAFRMFLSQCSRVSCPPTLRRRIFMSLLAEEEHHE
ncbi:MAG: anti-sigma factor family protein [Longimicrobiales bacterium]